MNMQKKNQGNKYIYNSYKNIRINIAKGKKYHLRKTFIKIPEDRKDPHEQKVMLEVQNV